MFDAIGAIVSFLTTAVTILPILIIFYFALRFRLKFFIVHEFSNDNIKLPGVVNKMPNEVTLKYATNFTKSNQFYLTTTRIIFHIQSLLRGKIFTRYFETKSIRNVEIVYKNPYGWLIVGGINLLFGLISASTSAAHNSNSSNFFNDRSSSTGSGIITLLIFLTLIESGLFVLIWYYLKGFYLMFDNGRISGLFCRTKDGLEDTLKRFDILKFTNKSFPAPEIKNVVPESKDIICKACKSVISLDSDDLKSSSFICPICTTENEIA